MLKKKLRNVFVKQLEFQNHPDKACLVILDNTVSSTVLLNILINEKPMGYRKKMIFASNFNMNTTDPQFKFLYVEPLSNIHPLDLDIDSILNGSEYEIDSVCIPINMNECLEDMLSHMVKNNQDRSLFLAHENVRYNNINFIFPLKDVTLLTCLDYLKKNNLKAEMREVNDPIRDVVKKFVVTLQDENKLCAASNIFKRIKERQNL